MNGVQHYLAATAVNLYACSPAVTLRSLSTLIQFSFQIVLLLSPISQRPGSESSEAQRCLQTHSDANATVKEPADGPKPIAQNQTISSVGFAPGL